MNPLLLKKQLIDFDALRKAAQTQTWAALASDPGVDPDADFHRRVLENVQGNILKAHGRPHAALIMIRLGTEAARNREFLRSWVTDGKITKEDITSSWQQLNHQRDFQQARTKSHFPPSSRQAAAGEAPFRSVILTDTGMSALGIISENRPHDGAFLTPMESRGARLGLGDVVDNKFDTPEDPWSDDGYREQIDQIVLVAHANLTGLAELIAETWERVREFGGRITGIENGFAWKPAGTFREPFGFADGNSNPVFIRSADQPSDDPPPSMALKELIVAEESSPLFCGSYLVFRKLEQDMCAFEKFKKVLEPPLVGRNQLHAAEVLIGRDETGQPLERLRSAQRNDFDYDDDRGMPARCPFHSHIRKANPRLTDSIKMVRRSMVFAEVGGPDASALDGRRGLLFLAYMAGIAGKFQSLHNGWLMTNKSQEPGLGSQPWLKPFLGPDPLLAPAGDYLLAHSSGLPPFTLPRPRLVIPRGGRYGFVPPLSWLRNLPP